MKYLGAKANKVFAYGVASVSGTLLAVCSCTVLPLFAGIYRMGAGLGPACTFLYSGPAINILAIVLTARILGMELGTKVNRPEVRPVRAWRCSSCGLLRLYAE